MIRRTLLFLAGLVLAILFVVSVFAAGMCTSAVLDALLKSDFAVFQRPTGAIWLIACGALILDVMAINRFIRFVGR